MLARLLFFCLLFAPASATAQTAGDCAPPGPSPELVERLIRWIGAETDYDIAATLAEPPAIQYCHTGEIIAYEGREVLIDETLRAAYDVTARRIYLVLPWDADAVFDRSVLLHELVHDIQLRNRDWPCTGAPEWEAYKLQEKWLLPQGVEHDFDWLHIYFQSRCPRDIHPD